MIDLSPEPDAYSAPPLQDHQNRPRFRSILTERERKLCDYLMMGYAGEELAAMMGMGYKQMAKLVTLCSRKVVDPPHHSPTIKLIVWRAKQIGAVEAYLGLRDTDGNHIDDGIAIARQAEVERRMEQMRVEYAPRQLGRRPHFPPQRLEEDPDGP